MPDQNPDSSVSSPSSLSSLLTLPPETPELIHRWTEGESLTALAAEIGISRQALTKRIKKFMLTEIGDVEAYKDLATEAMVSMISDADNELDDANTSVAVARAHAKARLTRQDFERRRPKLYGPKQEMSVDKTITVYVNRKAPQQVVVEGQTIEIPTGSSEEDQQVTAHITHPTKVQE